MVKRVKLQRNTGQNVVLQDLTPAFYAGVCIPNRR